MMPEEVGLDLAIYLVCFTLLYFAVLYFILLYYTLLCFDECGVSPAGFMHTFCRSHVGALISTSH